MAAAVQCTHTLNHGRVSLTHVQRASLASIRNKDLCSPVCSYSSKITIAFRETVHRALVSAFVRFQLHPNESDLTAGGWEGAGKSQAAAGQLRVSALGRIFSAPCLPAALGFLLGALTLYLRLLE